MKELMIEVESLLETGYSMFEISDILKVDEDLVEDCLDAMYAIRYPEGVVWH